MMGKVLARKPQLAGILSIGGGTLLGQLILIGATPLLSRMYSPAAFGAFSTIVAIATIVGPSAALRFDAGIVLPPEDRTVSAVAKLALLSTIVISLLSGGVVWALQVLGFGESWREVAFAPLWIALLVFLTAMFTVLTQIALRHRAYSLVAKRSPIQSTATAVGQLGLGLMLPSPAGLLGGFGIGRASGLIPMMRLAWPVFRQRGDSLSQTARTYWRLPVALAPSALMNSLGSQIPLLSIAAIFGASVAGEFSMAQRIVYIPVTLIGAAVAQVFGAELAKHVREGGTGATATYLRTSSRLAIIAAPVALLIALLGPPLLPFVLGTDWSIAGDFSMPLALSVGLALIVSPTSQVYIVFQSVASLFVDLSRILLMGVAIWACLVWQVEPVTAAWLLVAAQAVNYVITWFYGIRVTKVGRR